MINKLSIGVGFLLLCGLGSTAFILQSNILAGFEAVPLPPTTIDESMQGVVVQRFDKEGANIQTITVDKWYQYTKDPVIHMNKPMITLNHKNGSQWFLEAKNGVGYQASGTKGQFEKVTFLEKVTLIQKKDEQTQMTLDTEQLNYTPEFKQAYTDTLVQVNYNKLSMTASGLSADLMNNEITFLGKTKSIYVP